MKLRSFFSCTDCEFESDSLTEATLHTNEVVLAFHSKRPDEVVWSRRHEVLIKVEEVEPSQT